MESSLRFTRFKKISTDKKFPTQSDSANFPKWKGKKGLPDAPKLNNVMRVAVDPSIPASDLPPSCTPQKLTGSRRCERADLIVVSAMQKLREFKETSTRSSWLECCDLIYTIGLGRAVIVASTWKTFAGNPSKIPSQNIFFHAPAAKRKLLTFRYTPKFRKDNPEVFRALCFCSHLPKSTWVVEPDKDQVCKPGSKLVKTTSLLEIGNAIVMTRVLENFGCRAHLTTLK